MRILLLNQTFHPDLVATAQHMTDLARYLTQRGHKFDAIASRSAYQQHDSLLTAYEELGDIHIYRVGRSIFGKGSIAQRLIDFAHYYVAALVKTLRVPKPDVVLCLTTPPFIATVGLLLRALRGSKMVYYVMDLYPDVPVACGVLRARSPVTGLLERINRYCLRRADRTVVLGRCMLDRVTAKIGQADHLRLVPPWACGKEIAPLPAERNEFRIEQGWSGKFVAAYSGNLGLAHELETMLSAIKSLNDERDIHFAFVGGGALMEVVRRRAADGALKRVSILPYQPRERLGEVLSAADVHLISMREGTDGLIVPSKLYGIMAAGRPAVFIGPERSEIARTLREHECGFVVPVGDTEGLVAKLRLLRGDGGLAAEMGARARRAFERHFEREDSCARLMEILAEAAGIERPGAERAPGNTGSIRRASSPAQVRQGTAALPDESGAGGPAR
jgi:glycosyltransferase involved in cell wall biosynthesis